MPIVPKEILQLSTKRPLLAKLAVAVATKPPSRTGLVRYTPEPAAAHWTGPGMRQPAQAVSSCCNALRKNCQSLPFNAMRRSRKALDKNRQHGLASEGLPSNGRYTEEGEERSARQCSAGRAAPARTRGTGLGGEVRCGRPRRAAPLRVALPFQTVETVNESAQDRQSNLPFGPGFREEEWRNRLIWGDKKYVLPSLLPEFAGKVNLIYIDPPFDTGADFSFTATVPDDPETPGDDSFTFTKEPSIIEHKAYTWGHGLDSYLQWFYETAVLLHDLLHESGSIYVHLDWHTVHYSRIVLDEIFGQERMRNELVWCYHRFGVGQQKQFTRAHDTILWYSKGERWTFNLDKIRVPYSQKKLWTISKVE